MKNNKLLLIALLATFLLADPQEFDVNMHIDITEEAVNACIETQLFPHPIQASIGDFISGEINTPHVTFTQGLATATIGVTIEYESAGQIITFTYDYTFPISFNTVDISIQGIIADLENVPNIIQNTENIPQWIKDLLINEFEALDLLAYPNALIDLLNEQLPTYYDIDIQNFGISFFEYLDDKVRINLVFNFEASVPWVRCKVRKVNSNQFQYKFYANAEMTVTRLRSYILLGAEMYENEYDMNIPQSEGTDYIYSAVGNVYGPGNISTNNIIYIVAYFENENGLLGRAEFHLYFLEFPTNGWAVMATDQALF
ncbi:MAG: hypothetical protein HQ510_10885 [Candidatus Marinimicrobia bacterium]|nr:hypothetical protein [Candidatus Neomarinimicrobiota bacterium]